MNLAIANNVTISVNGEGMEVPSGTTVAALLELLHVETTQVAVERDGNVAQRERCREISITAGATLEIVRFVGGGSAFSLCRWTGVGRIGKCQTPDDSCQSAASVPFATQRLAPRLSD